ncbi:GntR family transcriptional regulator [Azorhizobium oxalatiphilum]|uniref:GntR family transcriptional regulator n=1 Tax=Azorhizobium oxalatiphilum TaxID=980631 RepID=A0A917CDN1_9HYPH|nr:PLP-dependent aminotransferase family protein [Azorhizobium oxalatiphilum]GGF81320.1 GntR family transcriptional regulator [Azorhizobium oxalatiphilum]
MSDTLDMRGDYRALADTLAADIASGRLPAGTRLPAQRDFAYQHKIAPSTASRVYGELTRRGLITGEVGRGSYVRALEVAATGALGEPVGAPVDLQLNFPILPGQDAELAQVLSRMMKQPTLAAAFRPLSAAATREARGITADFLARAGWRPDPEGIVFTANGRQAIAAAFAVLAPPGERIAVEALTYPAVKWIAARLGITLVPLPMDARGLRPDALLKAHRAAPIRGVYLQPILHNPLSHSMDAARRAEIADVLASENLTAVEDVIYGFLSEEAPLAAIAPEHTLLVDSLSKRVAPGLTLGFLSGPPAWSARLVSAVRTGAWAATGLPLAAALQVMTDGVAARLVAGKQKDAAERQSLLRTVFDAAVLKTDPRSYHAWLELPDHWRSDAFAAAAARRGIAITPSSAFCVTPGHAPNAVRLALSPPPLPVLRDALITLRQMAETGPMESEIE